MHTNILMYGGTVKMVEDVGVGDPLIGTPRTVQSLARGREDMYDIVPTKNKATTWGCNGSHIVMQVPAAGGKRGHLWATVPLFPLGETSPREPASHTYCRRW